jgi:serine protease Do
MKILYCVLLAILTTQLYGQQVMAQPQLRKLFSESNSSVVVIKTIERKVTPVAQSGLVSLPGLGSGVLITTDGKVLTAAHVVQAADYVGVEFAGGQSVPAHVIASYPLADVALLQIERVPSGVVPARLGDSDKMEVGDDVFIIGAPYGLDHSLTVGHVSARRNSNGAVGGHTKVGNCSRRTQRSTKVTRVARCSICQERLSASSARS